MKEETIILSTSDEAAQRKTVTGWVSRHGYFFGEDERTARYDGCTHLVCDGCGEIRSKSHYCKACYHKRQSDKYAAMPRKEWDGVGMLYSDAADRYFSDEDEVLDYCEEEECTPESLQLIICEPVYATEIDPNEHYHDELPEDGEVDGDLEALFDELNKFIRETKPILSWYPGKFAAII